MDEFIKFNSQTAGRDKIFRLVQYTSRIVWYNLQQRKSPADNVEKFKKLDEILGLVRRLLRFGRFVETFQSTFSVLTLSNTVLRLTSSLSRISNACFMFLDHVVCLQKLNLLPRRWKIDTRKWDRWSTKFWLYAILLGLVRDGYELFKIYCEETKLLRIRNGRLRSQAVHKSGLNPSTSKSSNHTDRNQAVELDDNFDETCPASRSAIMEMEVEKSTREIRQRLSWSLQQMLMRYLSRMHKISRWVIEHSDITIDTAKNLLDLPIPLNSLNMIRLKPSTIGYLGVGSTVLSALPQINPMFKMIPAM